MRAFPALVAALALAGCAHTGVSLFGGEKNADGTVNATGAVAVLDPVTGQDVVLVDKADASRNVRKNKVSLKNVTAAQLNKRYGKLLASLPEKPRVFQFFFPTGSAALTEDAKGFLPDLLAEVKRRPGADVQVVGHSDTVDSDDVNDRGSLKRAEAIRDELIKFGIDKDIIRATGRGEREPNVVTADNIDEPRNRFVEVIVK